MGIKRRYLSFDVLKDHYMTEGLERLKKEINKGDIIHSNNYKVDHIVDIVYSGKCDTSVNLKLQELFNE